MDATEKLARRILDDRVKALQRRAAALTLEHYPELADSENPIEDGRKAILRRLAGIIVENSPLARLHVAEGGKADKK
jgi:hypothetical protein